MVLLFIAAGAWHRDFETAGSTAPEAAGLRLLPDRTRSAGGSGHACRARRPGSTAALEETPGR
ncbi:MAG TPA: hypothetical protein PLB26_19135, partial [Rubrivivax sp.]|nr:hypothetical protein [Rubrivivax sp.]